MQLCHSAILAKAKGKTVVTEDILAIAAENELRKEGRRI